MSKFIDSFKNFWKLLPSHPRLYIGGGTGEPSCVSLAFNQETSLAKNVTFLGIWIPGINDTDWSKHHPTAKAESIFISAAQRNSFEIGDTTFLPITYSQSTRWLARTRIDGAIVMVSPPDSNEMVNLGASVDFAPTVLTRKKIPCLAIVNPKLKPVQDGVELHISRFSHQTEFEVPLPQFPIKSLPPAFENIGDNIASQISDGDTLQFGLGNVQQCALLSMKNHKDLRIHSGMVSDPLLTLMNLGVIAESPNAITTGVAVGTDSLYDEMCRSKRTRFRPVSFTHAIQVLAGIDRFKSINSALQIDLFGQVNAESLNGRQVSGLGGITDFHRGGSISKDGRSIIALSSATFDQNISRIVPLLRETCVSIGRAEADTFVTEYGVASVRDKSVDQRAEAIIGIAHPKFRDKLANQWHKLRTSL